MLHYPLLDHNQFITLAVICLSVFFCSNYTSVLFLSVSVGKVVKHLSLSLFSSNFLGSEEHAGFLYIRPTLQSLQGLPLPNQPYLFGLLVHRAELAWAKAFPLRLMLRLGAEYRCKPDPSRKCCICYAAGFLFRYPFPFSFSSLPMSSVQCALKEALVWGDRPHYNETVSGEYRYLFCHENRHLV